MSTGKNRRVCASYATDGILLEAIQLGFDNGDKKA